MRSSALAGFLASAVLVSGSAGFASTFLVGPYLGDQVRHQGSRPGLMSSAAPVDPLAVLQIPAASASPTSDGEPPASQQAHRLRQVENRAPAQTATAVPAVAANSTDMPGPITEEAFAPTAPNTMPVSAGGPLIATETSTAMVGSKLENGEPVLTLRIAPIVPATAPTVDMTNPDDAVEQTVMTAPPSEQALAATPIAAPAAAEPAAPPPAPEPVTKPRTKPATAALREPEPAPVEPTRRATTTKPKPAPARVSTTAAPAPSRHVEEEPVAPPPTPDPLNAPYIPSASPTLGNDSGPATGAPASMTPAPSESTGGPTPLTMPQSE